MKAALKPGVSVPSVALFGRDLTASVVVFLVAMPLCMGIAVASGVPPEKGLITGIIGGIVVRLGSRMVDASIRTKLNSIRTRMKEVG